MSVRPTLRLVSIVPLAVLAASAPLQAQEESTNPAPSEAVPAPSGEARPALPPARPRGLRPQPEQASAPGLRDDDAISNIQFPNPDVRAILAFYEQLTGKQTIYDNTVQGQVNIVVNRQVSRDEAVRIIETALLINGFNLVPGPGNIVKVIGSTKNARQYAVPILSDIRDLPENDHIISFLFKLEYADPTEVQQAISQYVAPSPYTVFVPLPKSQSLIVTESSNVVRQIIRVVEALDQPPAEVVSEFISLERADAKDIVEKLTVMFEKQPSSTGATNAPQSPSYPPPPNWAPPVPGPGGEPGQQQPNATGQGQGPASVTLSEDSLIIGKIKITADIRTNRIHVVTRPINMPFVRRLVAEYDSNISFGEPSKRTLRFVAAGEVLDVVVSAITEPGVKVEEGNASGTSGRSSSGATVSRGNVVNQNGNNGGSVSLGAEELSTKEVDTMPESRTVGGTRIIADKRANAIIVLGNQEVKDKIFRVLDQIDVRAPQVMLTAVIGELTLNDDEEFGVDYIQSLGRSLTTTGTGGTTTVTTNPATGFAGISRNTGVPITDLANLVSATSLASAGATGGFTGFIGATKSLEIIVHALESTGRFRITSRPMVFTSNNKQAIIASGQEIAIPGVTTSGYTGGDTLTTQSSVQYKEVDLKLEVMPLINSDREVTLDIVQEVNSVSGSTVISGNVIPTIARRRIKTNVTVANEATIVLGGLVQESKDNSRSGIPVLSRIPVLGSLFGNKKKTTKRTELVVLLRPTVTYGTTEAVTAGERVQEGLDFPPDLEATLDPPGMRVNANPPANNKRASKAKPQLRSNR